MSSAFDQPTAEPVPVPEARPAAPPPTAADAVVSTLDGVRDTAARVRAWMRDAVMGRDDVIELVLIALFGDGHVLLEDYPGSGKTTLANALGNSIADDGPEDGLPEFRRLQFTPDLLPSDVTGVMVFDMESNTFHFRKGPVFAYVVLVDEINRTTPKVQAAMLEAMAEKQVTVDNITHKLDDLFFVIATQNPLDAVGTYPLPLAQLDRFLFKVRMKHIDRDSELEVLKTWGLPKTRATLPKVARRAIVESRGIIRQGVHVAEAVQEALVDIARNLRADKRVLQGVSTRSLVLAIPALQTLAMLRGRDFVTPDDIERLAVPIFQHRMELLPGIDDAGMVIKDAIREPLDVLAKRTLKGA
ncbi:MAG: AAA family ATPase [Myxococcales bacterium]|nr:AAA family ATPase [Myxococcales bacterium]MCB9733124.1 AAA family ATPase [Deltaproteobacteria bacterium]